MKKFIVRLWAVGAGVAAIRNAAAASESLAIEITSPVLWPTDFTDSTETNLRQSVQSVGKEL
jgi:hypothetical protein